MNANPSAFAGNIERFSGFADLYDRYRHSPPTVLSAVLAQWSGISHPQLVVDLGSGTGLSTRYWADRAAQVIGIDPTADMRRQAQARTVAPNVTYLEGFSHQTGLPDRCADIVTCSQSLHWMEPQATFEEAARILRPGGVFAAYDYDWPPTTGNWEAELAYETCMERVRAYETAHETATPLRRWEKESHLGRMHESGCFRYTKEIVLHSVDQGNAERLVGLMLSQGNVMTLLKTGYSEEQLGIDVFRSVVERGVGPEPQTWYWSSRARLGIV